MERFFSLYTPTFFPLNHKSTTNLDTKHLYKNSYGYYYLNLRVKDKVYKFSLKTKDRYLSIERRNKIFTSINTTSSVKHDKITLTITRKILGIQMFEYMSEEDYQEYLRHEKSEPTIEEKLQKLIAKEKRKEELLNQQLEEERKRLEDLHNQERQHLLNIQSDIKLKFDNNELSLTEEQISTNTEKSVKKSL